MNIELKLKSYLNQFDGLNGVDFYQSSCSLPMYLSALYELTTAKILEIPVVLAQLKPSAQIPTIAQIKSQFKVCTKKKIKKTRKENSTQNKK